MEEGVRLLCAFLAIHCLLLWASSWAMNISWREREGEGGGRREKRERERVEKRTCTLGSRVHTLNWLRSNFKPLDECEMVALKLCSAFIPLFSKVNSSLNSGPSPKMFALIITLASLFDQIGPCPVVMDCTYLQVPVNNM